jgi:acyl-CoA synthetase (NDP forming)
VRTLLAAGYLGRVYPVNPNEEEILGLPCYNQLMNDVKRATSAADIHGVLVVPMAQPGTDLIVGMVRDAQCRALHYHPFMLYMKPD